MRSRLWLLVVLTGCGGEEARLSRDSVHPGEPTVRARSALADVTASEIGFLQYMIEHEWTIGDLLRRAEGHTLTSSGKTALEHARKHWFENEADLVAARQAYGGGRGSLAPPAGEPRDGLDRVQRRKHEAAFLRELVRHYREEVAAIDTTLPGRGAEHVRSLAKRIKTQRLHPRTCLSRFTIATATAAAHQYLVFILRSCQEHSRSLRPADYRLQSSLQHLAFLHSLPFLEHFTIRGQEEEVGRCPVP